jgi:hypothetical protein
MNYILVLQVCPLQYLGNTKKLAMHYSQQSYDDMYHIATCVVGHTI